MHHPFTRPKESDLDKIDTDPANCLADAYDIVLNGFELGGGLNIIYEQDLQQRAFKALSLTDEQVRNKFGWFVDAFKIWDTTTWRICFRLKIVLPCYLLKVILLETLLLSLKMPVQHVQCLKHQTV